LDPLVPRSAVSFTEIEVETSTRDISMPYSLPPALMNSATSVPEVGYDVSNLAPLPSSPPVNSLSTDSTDDNGDTSSVASSTDDSDSVFDDGQLENTSSYTASLLSDSKKLRLTKMEDVITHTAKATTSFPTTNQSKIDKISSTTFGISC
jgi:hypothetical protein